MGLTVTDTRYFMVGQTPFGYETDKALVIGNFLISVLLHVVATCIGFKLIYMANSKMHLASFGSSYKMTHTGLTFTILNVSVLCMSFHYRIACLRCMTRDHPKAYACFDEDARL